MLEWKTLETSDGNPMLKFDDGTNRQMTIHYDPSGHISASHIKKPNGSREFINPSDAFIAAELMRSW